MATTRALEILRDTKLT